MTNDVRFIMRFASAVLHEQLRLGVERRRRLVEHENRRVLEQRARNRQPLPLAAGEPLSPLADHRVVAVGQRRHEVVRVRRTRRGLDRLRRRVRRPVGDVGGDRVVEEHGLLRHDADLRAQRRQRHVADVHAVDENRPARDVVEPRQQVDQRRLAGAAAADDGDHLAGLDVERHAAQDARLAVLVAEADVAELDRRRNGAIAGAPARSFTSVWVSSMSKMRSDAAIVCCRFALTRLSFLAGPYISSSAAMNEKNASGGHLMLRRHLTRAVDERERHADAADELHQRRQARQRRRHLHVRAEESVRGAAELVGSRALRCRTPSRCGGR